MSIKNKDIIYSAASPEQVARVAVTNDRAEVIVLGCAGLAGLDKYLQEKLNVPVLDGVICAIIFASGMVRI